MGRRRILGAVLAGGESRRFGSDKALATIDGRPLIDHAILALRPVVGTVAVCGRAWLDEVSLADRRDERVGPLGGIEAALNYACERSYDGVLAVPVDTYPLARGDLEALPGEALMAFQDQYTVAYWPVSTLPPLSAYLNSGRRSLIGLLTELEASFFASTTPQLNVNRKTDVPRLHAAVDSAAGVDLVSRAVINGVD